jgi:invasion protein IalB
MEINMASRRFRKSSLQPLATLALCFAFSMTAEAFGQVPQHDDTPAKGRPTQAEIGAQGQHMPRNITYSPWQKICFKDSLAHVVCRTTTNGTWDTGQTAVRVDLIERRGDSATRLQVFLPVGLYIQAGVKVTVDAGLSVHLPYNWCLTNICVAGNLIEPYVIDEIEAGQKLTLQVVDSNLLTIPTTISLNQFATAYKGMPTKTVELPTADE